MELNFADPGEVNKWVNGWVATNTPTSIEMKIAEFESTHLDHFMKHYGRGVVQFYVEYDALVSLIDQVNFIDKGSWPPHRVTQFVLLSKNLKAFHSAMDRLSKGFCQDAVTLIRGLYDAFLRVLHISCYSNKPEGALLERPAEGTTRFNATDIVQVQLRLDWTLKYRLMSVYAHANTFEAITSLQRIQDNDGNPERYGLVFEKNVRLLEMAFPFLQFLMLVNLRFVIERLIGPTVTPDPAQFSTAKEAVAFLTHCLVTHPKPYWHETVVDLDYVFNLLDVADSGGDWRKMRDRRPTVTPRRTSK